MEITLTVNGTPRRVDIDPRRTLLDVLRLDLGLTGSKKGCDHGQCGACTVILGDRRINSCLALAVMHDGEEVTTVEGLETPAGLSPLQRAFLKTDGLQCGFCTPGQLCSATAMIEELREVWPSHASEDLENPEATRAELAERMSGNLCRCACYPGILDAIEEVIREGLG